VGGLRAPWPPVTQPYQGAPGKCCYAVTVRGNGFSRCGGARVDGIQKAGDAALRLALVASTPEVVSHARKMLGPLPLSQHVCGFCKVCHGTRRMLFVHGSKPHGPIRRFGVELHPPGPSGGACDAAPHQHALRGIGYRGEHCLQQGKASGVEAMLGEQVREVVNQIREPRMAQRVEPESFAGMALRVRVSATLSCDCE
jgi:hypothetical protein